MDLQRIRDLLPSAIDVDANWRRYLDGGGLPDDDAFIGWLAREYPDAFDLTRTLAALPVEVTRLAPSGDPADATATRIVAGPADTSSPVVDETPRGPHYVLIGVAGKGGMGTVHIARDTELLRHVALKQLDPQADAFGDLAERFVREAQITAQLDHPNVVPVHALERAPDGTPAYTMKLVEGRTFQSLIETARDQHEMLGAPDDAHALPTRLEHFLKVCDAVAYAHEKGVIHRDLKPANLMLGRHNEVYVMDWGLCRLLRQPDDAPAAGRSAMSSSPEVSGGASETQAGFVIGTPKYMPPEQAQGRNRDLDARSDQCALGLILYELVTLAAPYEGRSAREVLANAAAGRRRAVAHAVRGVRVPRELRAIVERATAPEPARRYADVAALAADLRRHLRGEAVLARPDTLWQRCVRFSGRHRQAMLSSLLGLVALASMGIGASLLYAKRSLEETRWREQRVLALRSALADVGDRVQTRTMQLDGALQTLAASAELRLDDGLPSTGTYYLLDDFNDPRRAPDDREPDPMLGGLVSMTWPVWTLAPGADAVAASARIRRLVPMQESARRLYERIVRVVEDPAANLYDARPRIVRMNRDANPAAPRSPVVAIVLGLADGTMMRYPGWTGLADGYDPRQRPWYRMAEQTSGPRWGDPYLSSISHRIELPLSVALYDHDHEPLGVISLLLLPELMVERLLDIENLPGIHDVLLVDANGHVLAARAHHFAPRGEQPDQVELRRFDVPEALAHIRAGTGAVIEARVQNVDRLVVIDPVSPHGWSVIAIADREALFTRQDEADATR